MKRLTKLTKIKTGTVLLFLSFITVSCNENNEIITHVYESGCVRFNYDETVNKFGIVRGKLKVKVDNNWVEVTSLGDTHGDNHWIIPRERVVYIGEEIK